MTAEVRRGMRVTGIVQGVGFRPTVRRLAADLDLSGFVRNEVWGVLVEVQGRITEVDRFEPSLMERLPPLARIDAIEWFDLGCLHDSGFAIVASDAPMPGEAAVSGGNGARGGSAPVIPADTAVCDDCLEELRDPADRRYRHPFITCTNCGPRFTIVTGLPFDRVNTTMAGFPLCSRCSTEYADPADRRHHAQALACPECGPRLWHERAGVVTTTGDDALAQVQEDLAAGLVVAVKGLGGYHLAVDATDQAAVRRLRDRKHRPDKPLAVMVADLAAAARVAIIGPAEARALTSPAHPIVLLARREGSALSEAVAPGSPLVGVMLAYTPLHHLLFAPVPSGRVPAPTVLVMTSGNVAGEPICFDDAEARTRLEGLVDSFCAHDRPIHAPCDDSVVRVIDGSPVPIRRSRGYVPLPIRLPVEVGPTLAVGGDVKNTFCLASGRNAWMSQHLGDMEHLASLESSRRSMASLCELHGITPRTLAVDAHPGYRTRRWVRDDAEGRMVMEVFHHHAHLAALMAEHGMDGRHPVLGFVFDGTGYGPDGTLWGGEVLIADYERCERRAHLVQVPLPGGDGGVRNPYRMALAHLTAAGIAWDQDIASVRACDRTEQGVLATQIGRGIGCVPTSSVGRLFDAVASLLDVRHHITYEAQAAIELEALAATHTGAVPDMRFGANGTGDLDAAPVVRAVVSGVRSGQSRAALARGFHIAVVEAMVGVAEANRRERSIGVVGLTGGVFQNALLASGASARLTAAGFRVLTHRVVPPNDGGLALGQAVIAGVRVARQAGRKKEAAPCA